MSIWSSEIKELERLYESFKGHFPDLEKELGRLIKSDDENMILLYSRRCLEVIITDLCECELKRERGTEPLKGIIDKLNKEKKVPSNIITSMHGLNDLSTYGTHPKDFDPEQVKPVLVNLDIIIKWYLKNKWAGTDIKAKPSAEIRQEIKSTEEVRKSITIPRRKLIALVSGLILFIIIVVAVLYFNNVMGGGKQAKELEKSIAVLPFRNDSPDSTNQYFIDGTMEAILDNLCKIADLTVISRTSVEQFRNTNKPVREIAKGLGVNYILEGSGQKYGNDIRLTVQLIDAVNDKHLWSSPYEGIVDNIFKLQSQIAQVIAEKLKATITPREKQLIDRIPSSNKLAYDFYLKGKDYWAKYEVALALDMYSKAIQEDSLFSLAIAQRAVTHLYFFWNKFEGWQGHDLKGKEDIKKGLLLNPNSPEIKFAEAVAYYYLDHNYNNSVKILNELKTDVPNMADLYAYSSYILRRQGKWEESIKELERAIGFDPFNANYINNLSFTYQVLHQYDIEINYYKQGLTLIPDHKFFSQNLFIAYLNKTGDLQLALKESGLMEEDAQFEVYYYTRHYNEAIEFINKRLANSSTQYQYTPKVYQLALMYNLQGNKSLCEIYADSAIIHLKEKIKENPYDDRFYSTLGKCYAFIGKDKEAIAYGKKAIDLKPIKTDAIQGICKEQDLMEIYIFIGDYELALDKIGYLLSVPSWLSAGDLLIDPIYDNLRNLPRFKKILKSINRSDSTLI